MWASLFLSENDQSLCWPHFFYSLSNFLFRAISSWVVHAFGEVLDESNSLGDADLLLFCQLGGQSRLAGCRVVDRNVNLLLRQRKSRQDLRKKQIKGIELLYVFTEPIPERGLLFFFWMIL